MKERKTTHKETKFITKNSDFQSAFQLSRTHDTGLYIYKLKKKKSTKREKGT